MFFNEDYLRVLKPVTTDGTSLKFGPDGKRVMKTSYAPKIARPYLEKRNLNLPDNLKLIIEEVAYISYEPQPVVPVDAQVAAANERIAELEAQLQAQQIAQINAKAAGTVPVKEPVKSTEDDGL